MVLWPALVLLSVASSDGGTSSDPGSPAPAQVSAVAPDAGSSTLAAPVPAAPATATGPTLAAPAAGSPRRRAIVPLGTFEVFKEDSGPVNYYSVTTDEGQPILRAVYKPPLGNVVLMGKVPELARASVKSASWRWRARVFPQDANDCGPGQSDEAASVFLVFKAGLKLMAIKYSWATVGTVGASCVSNRGWFFDRDTLIVQVAGPTDTWVTHTVDPRREFVKRFGGKLEDVPEFVAFAVMTDGDNSKTAAEADYADFVVEW